MKHQPFHTITVSSPLNMAVMEAIYDAGFRYDFQSGRWVAEWTKERAELLEGMGYVRD